MRVRAPRSYCVLFSVAFIVSIKTISLVTSTSPKLFEALNILPSKSAAVSTLKIGCTLDGDEELYI